MIDNKKQQLGETILHAIKVACELNGYDTEKFVIKMVLADIKEQKTHPMTLIGSDVPADRLQEIEFAILTSHIDAVKKMYPGFVETKVVEAQSETKH